MKTNFIVGMHGNADVGDLLVPRGIFESNLFVWGYNGDGQLGTNDTNSRSFPIQIVAKGNWKTCSGGYYSSAAIKTNGTLWLWGNNNYGQLGTNDRVNRSSPVQVYGGGTNWKLVSVDYSTAAIKTDGTLWVWGDNYVGELGTNDRVHRSSPIQVYGGGTNWKVVCAHFIGMGAIKTDGTLWTWGDNRYGQLGTNDVTHRSSPIQVYGGGTNWSIISCSYVTAAIKTDGTLWVWGLNDSGQLGVNDITHRSSPVQTIAGGTNWKSVSVNYNNIAAIKTDGTLWTCGINRRGQLGTNDFNDRSSPVQTVAGGTNWKTICACYDHTLAIKTDGTLWTWGSNEHGQLGVNDTTHRSSPVQVGINTNWKSISGNDQTLAIINIE